MLRLGTGSAHGTGDRSRSARARPRIPGLTYAVLTAALCVLIGTIALTSRQASPPTIAEFAPQAVEQITDSTSDGAGARAGASPETSEPDDEIAPGDAARQTVDVARVRHCVGDPPRQIEDPQSPPCVPYWSGDNGGATYKGVSRDEIRIVVGWRDAQGSSGPERQYLIDFFNRRFEFYGRKINLVSRIVNMGAIDAGGGEPQRRAHAVAVDEEHRAFAGLPFDTAGTGDFHEEMHRRGLVSIEPHTPWYAEDWLSARRPHIWMYPMASDKNLTNTGRWACSRLVGHHAEYSADVRMQSSPRVFGLVGESWKPGIVSFGPLERELAGCGAPVRVKRYRYRATWGNDYFTDPTNHVLQMKNEGVTTIFCFCNVVDAGLYARAATGQGYFPEWVLNTFWYTDNNWFLNCCHGERTQLRHTLGLTIRPRQWPTEKKPSRWAQSEMQPDSADPAQSGEAEQRDWDYQQLLLLAAGIQMAGPHLTPATFERGLHRTVFPNPSHPIMAGRVGFSDGDHTMTQDAAEWWWSNTDRGPFADDAGTICYVDGGARHHADDWPRAKAPFFQAPCDSGAY